MENKNTRKPLSTKLLRALIEVSFIVFLFYSNLLMGEYTGTNTVGNKSLWWAICNVFTVMNFSIALITGIAGYFVFEFLRKKL
jgi:hypothetical protein